MMETLTNHPLLSPTRILAWAVACFLFVPILVIIPISFTPERFLSMPTTGFSLKHYGSLISDPRWSKSIIDSLIVAVSATVIAVTLGTAFAIGAWRLGVPIARRLRLLMLAPIIVPPIVHAIAFYRVWAVVGLLDSYIGLTLVHAMKGLPFVVLTVAASLANVDPRLEQAARSLGASPLRALTWVVLPQIRTGLAAGAAFAFVTSWDETVVSLFLTSRNVVTLPRRIWEGLADNIDPAIAALGSLMVVATLAIVLVKTFRLRSAGA